MKRAFYTDPLAAAWMAKHHGMHFEHPYLFDGEDMPSDKLALVYFADMGEQAHLYIHPDSLPLLDVRVGDIARWWVTTTPDYFAEPTSVRTKEHLKKVTKNMLFYMKHGAGVSRVRVLERDGKPFHWPEFEA